MGCDSCHGRVTPNRSRAIQELKKVTTCNRWCAWSLGRRVLDPVEAEDSENNRAQERGHRKANARGKDKVGESSLTRSFQFKKFTVLIQKKEHLTWTLLLVGQCGLAARQRVLQEATLRQCEFGLARNVVGKQERIARLTLWKRSTIFVESENS